jgi:hypothetical protein
MGTAWDVEHCPVGTLGKIFFIKVLVPPPSI